MDIIQASKIIKNGGIVAFPTETVYGLGAKLFDPTAIEKIFSLKKREKDNPLIVHISTMDQVANIASEIPASFYRLAKSFFPGPLTIVLPKSESVPSIATSSLDTVAIRMPNHPIALKLLEEIGEPLVAPSANLSGSPSPTSAFHVVQDFGKEIPVLDGGPCAIGIESTVLKLLPEPVILRPGAITKEQLEAVLECKISSAVAREKPESPGMKYRHYAPNAKIILFEKVESLLEYAKQEKKKRIILSRKEILIPYVPSFFLSEKSLYHVFRHADILECEEVLVLTLAATEALLNRLQKATRGDG